MGRREFIHHSAEACLLGWPPLWCSVSIHVPQVGAAATGVAGVSAALGSELAPAAPSDGLPPPAAPQAAVVQPAAPPPAAPPAATTGGLPPPAAPQAAVEDEVMRHSLQLPPPAEPQASVAVVTPADEGDREEERAPGEGEDEDTGEHKEMGNGDGSVGSEEQSGKRPRLE